MDSPETWRWIWLVAAAIFALGEMSAPGGLFLLPFAVGALVAAVLAFGDVSVAIEWAAFLSVSIVAFAALRPVARRLNQSSDDEGVGARRLISQTATVLREIPAGVHELGLVRVHREEWRAEAVDGSHIAKGTTVRVVDVRGTRVVVADVAALEPAEADTDDTTPRQQVEEAKPGEALPPPADEGAG